MSRRYDDSFCDVPYEQMMVEDYVEDDFGIMYRRIGNTYYFVSSDGYVISMMKERPRILDSWPTQYGHRTVRINGIDRLVHRLVAEAFIPNPYGYPVVRHLDDDPSNNDYRNLAWGTYSDNMKDCVDHNRMPSREVYDFNTGILYKSCGDASKALGVTRGLIVMCCKGLVGQVKGHRLCYYEEFDEKSEDLEWGKDRTPYKRTIGISPSGERVIFSSRKEASKALGIPDSSITNVIVGRNKQTHGWRFEEG